MPVTDYIFTIETHIFIVEISHKTYVCKHKILVEKRKLIHVFTYRYSAVIGCLADPAFLLAGNTKRWNSHTKVLSLFSVH